MNPLHLGSIEAIEGFKTQNVSQSSNVRRKRDVEYIIKPDIVINELDGKERQVVTMVNKLCLFTFKQFNCVSC